MIKLFNIDSYEINTNNYSNLLHDKVITTLENSIADYTGAKYAVGLNSATNAIFLSLLNKNTIINVPSIIPPVVLNAILASKNKYRFNDNIEWVGNSYILHKFSNYKIIDSAQKIEKSQFKKEADDKDLMIFSFYPTKPIGSCDGGMIVSNDKEKIENIRALSLNGMIYSENNWERQILFPGHKMYMNSIQADIAFRNFQKYEYKLEKLNTIKEIYNKAFGLKNTSNHLYRLNVKNREQFVEKMKKHNIMCGIHYEAMHLNPVYALIDAACPKSTLEAKSTVSIPFHEKLLDDEIDYIIKTILSCDNYYDYEN